MSDECYRCHREWNGDHPWCQSCRDIVAARHRRREAEDAVRRLAAERHRYDPELVSAREYLESLS